jgi:hypothetical protein
MVTVNFKIERGKNPHPPRDLRDGDGEAEVAWQRVLLIQVGRHQSKQLVKLLKGHVEKWFEPIRVFPELPVIGDA